jgi:transglutaminase-like putative cysteine protease
MAALLYSLQYEKTSHNKPKPAEHPEPYVQPKPHSKPKPLAVNKPIPNKVETPKPQKKIYQEYDLTLPKRGQALDLDTHRYAQVTPRYKLSPEIKYGYSLTGRTKHVFASVKPSTSNHMYFVNGYLNGFVPYKTENLWMVLQYLQTRLKYQLDEIGYRRAEVWQTSKESYTKLRGDCEDHAILLADWLIGLGYDARVVAGMVQFRGKTPEGHAWVVLFYNDKEYLLEATNKSKWNRLPLASMLPYYFPKYMFNRSEFWYNTGSTHTTIYSDSKWKKYGEFIPSNPYYKDLG